MPTKLHYSKIYAMQPTTATEIRIAELSNALPAITKSQYQSAFVKCFGKYAVQSRKTIFCLECGHDWKTTESKEIKSIKCEKCHTRLVITHQYKSSFQETDYYQIITTAGEFQLVRTICVKKHMKKNYVPSYFGHEVMQIFIDENGKARTMAKNVMGMSRYYDQWIVNSELTLKHNDRNRFYLRGVIHPHKKILPIIKRNGFQGNCYAIPPQQLLCEILSDNIAETLLKTNQHSLLYFHIRNSKLPSNGRHWNALKICNRNGYIIKDAKLWVDYIDLLGHFNKDLRNPKYVCPVNLKQRHDKLVTKKLRETLADTLERKKAQITANQKHYLKAKKQFFGLVFIERNISINVIESVKEFLEEGIIHNHCVFTNDYYKKENSLILSAKVNGIHAETIQVNLENLEILQSRGKGNKATTHHKAIISLVKKNLHQIGSRMKIASDNKEIHPKTRKPEEFEKVYPAFPTSYFHRPNFANIHKPTQR